MEKGLDEGGWPEGTELAEYKRNVVRQMKCSEVEDGALKVRLSALKM